MKKLLLLILIIASSFAANSQNLQNAIWFGTHPPSPNLYFKFWNDTLLYSTNGGSYTVMSKFTASGGQLNIFDIMSGSMCSDTGHYNYTINGTSLSFQVITDLCASRRNTLVNYAWTLISTGVNEINQNDLFSLYPNPADNGITVLTIKNFQPGNSELKIFDLSGKLVYSESIIQAKTSIDLSSLPKGNYITKLSTGSTTTSSLLSR